MINQQINLYQDQFRERRLWISATQVALALVIVIAVVSSWSFLLQSQLEQEQQRSLAIKSERDQMTAELTAANAELAVLLKDRRLDLKIEAAARQISARARVLNFVEANQFGSGRGFSDYLVALSRLQMDNVWLNRLRFADDMVEISGSALKAADVPVYFDGFGEEQVFQGSRFDMFELSRPDKSDWKVDFEIATRAGSDG